jgi:hypothetical protein
MRKNVFLIAQLLAGLLRGVIRMYRRAAEQNGLSMRIFV